MPDERNHSFRLIAPHGGVLVNRLLDGDVRDVMRERAQALTRVPLSPMNVADIECISTGVYSPMTGFMRKAITIAAKTWKEKNQ